MSVQMNLSHGGVYRAVRTIRWLILSCAKDAGALLDGEIELDESYFGDKRKGERGRGATGKVLILGIWERNGRCSGNGGS